MGILLLFLSFFGIVSYIQTESIKQQVLGSILQNISYDTKIPPGIYFGAFNEERPTNVSVQLFITQIYEVNVEEMDLSISCYLRQRWFDHRLRFNYTNITLQIDQADITKIWTPDTYFPESIDGSVHDVTKRNTLMHIFHNGTVLYSLRLNIKLGCKMNFHLYPLDVQICNFHLASYGYTSNELLYSWFENSPVIIDSQNLPLYSIPENPITTVKPCHDSLFPDASGFSCLEMTIEFHRNIGYHMTEVFIPDILIVSLSWVTFWLHPLAVPGRVSLGAVTVLTMSSQGSASRRNAPKVSYVKAIDVWTLFQIMFVFAAMLEFSIVNVLARKKISEEAAAKYREGNAMDPDKDESRRPFLPHAKRTDYVCRIAFPAVYAFFNFMFWVIVGNI